MSNDLLHIAQRALQGAKKSGAQGARAAAYRERTSAVEWRDGKLDRLRESTQMGLSLTLLVDGRYSSHTTSDLRPTALDGFIAKAIAMTRILALDPHRKLPDPRRYGDRFAGELRLFDGDSITALTPQERLRIAAELEEAARAVPGKEAIISVTTEFDDSDGESAMVASNGMQGERRGTSFMLYAETTVREEGHRKPEGYWWESRRWRKELPPVAFVGREASTRALRDRGGKPEKSGLYPCVIENAVVSRLIGDLLAPLQGQAIQQRRSFLADKLGQRIANAKLTLVDDPHRPAGHGSRLYDGEGMSTVRRPVLERGVLKTFFLDTYYASKLGKEPTSAGPTNLAIEPGTRDLAALLKAMGRGILITGFSGGNANGATGDFSVGIRGQWIDGGQIVRPVSEMNLAGNHLQLWNSLEETGNDLFLSSSTISPSLRFAPVQFSGV
jgi:PmbA protein